MPSGDHLPVRRYVHPDTFKMYKEEAYKMGFVHAAVGAMGALLLLVIGGITAQVMYLRRRRQAA